MGHFLLKIILVILIYLLLKYIFHHGISSWLGVGRRGSAGTVLLLLLTEKGAREPSPCFLP
ncbi:hypothetical protein [Rossellomorea arthrocnemi]|uniref:hypothetical protein n=1 Tax=Rossellomorea arthrocnemi TaxID=2769542 RepID=UPI001918AFF2|nr:hypothetical protein [Rossellomorea arthrocnemi]